MKKLICAALLAAGSLSTPAAVLVATPAAAITCSDSVPETYKRDGGYCTYAESSNSLAAPDKDFVEPPPVVVAPPPPDNGNCFGYQELLPKGFFFDPGARVLLAC